MTRKATGVKWEGQITTTDLRIGIMGYNEFVMMAGRAYFRDLSVWIDNWYEATEERRAKREQRRRR